MYYSPSRKFLFLHARKVAGSSVKVQLARQHADDDVMIGGWPDAISQGADYNKRALRAAKSQKMAYTKASIRNFLLGKGFRPTPKEMNRLIKHHYQSQFGLEGAAHANAASLKQGLGEGWDSAFKFAFVRNPWDHAVSDYYWRNGQKKGVSFKEFLHLLHDPATPDPNEVRPPIITNWSVYTIDGQIVADFIGRFEKLDSDLADVSKQIGIDLVARLPHSKSRSNTKSKSVADHYDDQSIALVHDIYRNEIEAFGYQVPF
ncbi:sulfotransferase family 2 domain-containing protein [Tateyamaria pelophila]|uniref:sulfotransferase family 2 domain-containing protein n=1 Tax=Tateyamaria pelophila TaxID=328415 RepID=UPI001CBD986F|nr:sulfotransferase family 2 domain-containing protein [Tateyamaria pelophila]